MLRWGHNISHLYVVAPVWWRNHIDVKLMARPKNPLEVITSQNIGIFRSGLQIEQIRRSTRNHQSCWPRGWISEKRKPAMFPMLWFKKSYMLNLLHMKKTSRYFLNTRTAKDMNSRFGEIVYFTKCEYQQKPQRQGKTIVKQNHWEFVQVSRLGNLFSRIHDSS